VQLQVLLQGLQLVQLVVEPQSPQSPAQLLLVLLLLLLVLLQPQDSLQQVTVAQTLRAQRCQHG
jgi:hypothetical protein